MPELEQMLTELQSQTESPAAPETPEAPVADDPAAEVGEEENNTLSPKEKGLLSNLQKERRKRQEVESRFERELAELRGQMTALNTKPKETAPAQLDLNQLDEVDFVSGKQMRQLLEQHQQVLQSQQMQRESAREQARLASLEAKARIKYAAEKTGEGLDWESVTRQGRTYLTPGDAQAILQSDDPASEMYELCVFRNPFLRELRQESGAAKAPPRTKTQPKAAPAGSFEDRLIEMIGSATPEELAKVRATFAIE